MNRPIQITLLCLLAGISLGQAAEVSEEARRAFIKGSAVAKEAKSASEQALAVKHFEEAVRLAPGWADALYNLAVAQELAGRYSDAQATLKRYIQTKPGEKEARKAQDKIYALEGKADLAAVAAAKEEAKKAEEARRALAASLDGATFVKEEWIPSAQGGHTLVSRNTLAINGGRVTLTEQMLLNPTPPDVGYGDLKGLSAELRYPAYPGLAKQADISPDGRQALVRVRQADGSLGDVTVYTRR